MDILQNYKCPVCNNRYYNNDMCSHNSRDLIEHYEILQSKLYELEYEINKLKDQIHTVKTSNKYNTIIKK